MRPLPLSHLAPRLLGSVLACSLLGGTSCSEDTKSGPPAHEIDEVGVLVPKLEGWEVSPEAATSDLFKGGTALRLVRANAPAGSPRIDVFVAPANQGTTLDAFLTQGLRQMGDLESQGTMRITSVDQQPIQLGPRRAHLVRHEYTMGRGERQLAFTQLTTFIVVDGRGVSVTALGRTELFAPLEDSIHRILTGLRVAADGAPPLADKTKKGPAKKSKRPEPLKPVDLGTVGGK